MRRRDAAAVARLERMWSPLGRHPEQCPVREMYAHMERQFRAEYDFALRHHRLNAEGLRLCSLALMALHLEVRDA